MGPPRFNKQLGFCGARMAGEDKAAAFLCRAGAKHLPRMGIGLEVIHQIIVAVIEDNGQLEALDWGKGCGASTDDDPCLTS